MKVNSAIEQIENISVTPGKSVTLDGCTVTLSSVIPGKNEPFSVTNPNSDYCRSQVPQKYDIPFAAVLAIAGGYCAEGTYSLANVAQTAWDEYICNYNMSPGVCYGTSNCPMMENRFADVSVTFTVKKTLQAVEEQSLDFGTIIAMPYLQAITVDTNGNVSGNAIPVGSETSAREGRFAVIGAAGKTVNITVPAAAKIISMQGAVPLLSAVLCRSAPGSPKEPMPEHIPFRFHTEYKPRRNTSACTIVPFPAAFG